MPSQPSQRLVLMEERSGVMQQDTKVMLKLAEILLQDQLISPEEKYHLTQLIRKDDDV